MQTLIKSTSLATILICSLATGIAAAQDAPQMRMTTPIPAEMRLYGPEEAWFNKTSRPGEMVPVE